MQSLSLPAFRLRQSAESNRSSCLSRRQVFKTTAALAPAVALTTGCSTGNGTDVSVQATAAAELSRSATLHWLTRQPYEWAFDLSIKLFREKFPQAQVQRDQQANNNAFDQKLETLIAGGTPPDLAYAVGSTYHGQAARGLFDDLNPFMARDRALDRSDFVPFWLSAGQFRDKQYMFPFDAGTVVMFWNKQAFATAGLKPPDPKRAMTWPEFLEQSRALTRVPPAVPDSQLQFGTALYAAHLWWLMPYANGAEVFNKEGTKCLLNEPKAVEAMQFAVDLRLKHATWRPSGFPGRGTNFQGGTQATMHTGYWTAGGYRDQMGPLGLDFDLMPAPVFPGQSRVTGGWNSGHAMVASARQKALTWELEKVVAGKEVYEILLERGVAQPVRKSQEQSPAYRKQTPPHSYDVPVDDAKTARTPPFHTALLEVQEVLVAALDEAYAGKNTVKALMEQAIPQINQKLAEHAARFPMK